MPYTAGTFHTKSMVLTLLVVLLAVVLARWFFSEWSGGPRVGPATGAEVARLRGEVDELTNQVRRLAEEQEFLVRLLDERGRLAPPAAPSEEGAAGALAPPEPPTREG